MDIMHNVMLLVFQWKNGQIIFLQKFHGCQIKGIDKIDAIRSTMLSYDLSRLLQSTIDS